MGEISLAHNEAENLLALRRLESRFSSRYREYPSDPRRHAFAPVDTYSALSSSKVLSASDGADREASLS